MAQLSISIQSLQDAANGQPLFADLDPDTTTESAFIQVGILEGGTVGGQTSLMIVLPGANGEPARIGQLTGRLFEALYQAYQGAEQRFAEQKSAREN